MQIGNVTVPKVGQRIIKSSVGVFLGFVIYFLRGQRGTPFYTALSVLWCIQPYSADQKRNALQRTIGSTIGAIYGLIVIMMEFYFVSFQNEMLRYLVISLFIIPVIYTTILINKKNASYFSCVVFLSIVVIHLEDANPYLFVFNRMLDTLIGIGVAYVVNSIHLPKKKRTNILFVSEVDNVLLTMKETITPYSKFELNKMIAEGANFTIATMRPPASVIPALTGINIKLPVITMNGAVLFDIKNKKCLKKYDMTYDETIEYLNLFRENNMHCFINTMIEDSVVIYYSDFVNDVEKTIYENMRKSPYRNYVKQDVPPDMGSPVYLMIVDTEEKIENMYQILEEKGYTERNKIIKYYSDDFEGYMYIKIYNKDAGRENMILEIQKMTGLDEVVTFGEDLDVSTASIKGRDCNEIIRKFKKMFEYVR